jgi:hypothetical protein
MSPLSARVHDAHLLLDVPADLPEGTEVELVAGDDGYTLNRAERAALHADIGTALVELKEGRGIPLEEFLATFPPSDP